MKGHEAYLAMIGAVDEQLAIRERAVAELAAVGERAGKAAKEHDEATEAIRVVVADFLRGERASLDPIGLRHTASIGGVLTRRPDPRAALSAVLDMNGIPPASLRAGRAALDLGNLGLAAPEELEADQSRRLRAHLKSLAPERGVA